MPLRTLSQFRATFNPANWTVNSNDGTTLVAKNSMTGESYSGSPFNFKTFLNKKISNGAELLVDDLGYAAGYRTSAGDTIIGSTPVSRPCFALGSLNQSVEFGALQVADELGTKHRASFSAVDQGYIEGDYRNLAVSQHGSPLTLLIQKLASEARIYHHNGGLGSMSLVNDGPGLLDVSGWQPNKAYRGNRAADLPNGDWGHLGEFILENGQWWECLTGCDWLYYYNSDTPKTMTTSVNPTMGWTRNLTSTSDARNTNRTSANVGAKPTFTGGATPNVTTVTDNGTGSTGGGCVWICRTPGSSNVADGTANGRSYRVMRLTDSGFDQMRTLVRLKTALMATPVGINNRYCLITMTSQSDAGKDSGLILKTCQLIGSYMLDTLYLNGSVKPIFSGSIFNPANSTTNYDIIENALTGAGIAGVPNYTTNPLQALFASQSYTLGNPGVTGRTGALYFIIPTGYRMLGTDIVSYLQTPQPDPHLNVEGCNLWSNALYPYVRKILLNTAT